MPLDPAQPHAGEVAFDEAGFGWPLAFMHREQFRKGDYLFKTGDSAEKLYLIVNGSILLPELGRSVKAGQVLGEVGIFSPNRSRSASAVAEVDVDAYAMGREEVRQLMSRDPSLATKLIEVVLKRVMGQLKTEIEARERINAELRIARDIQARMLPRVFPPFPSRKDFEIYALMEPASEVGGDFYDFFLVEETRLCILVGDVSGKGVPAALLMALSKTLLRSEAMRGHPVAEVVARVNRMLCADNPECMFLTVFCLILNTRTGEAEYCCAGHNPPLWRQSDGSSRFLECEPGLLVGFDESSVWESKSLRLSSGDILCLYTDGVTEAENAAKAAYSEERFRASISGAHSADLTKVVEFVRQDIAQHAQGQPQSDDITLLALKYCGSSR
jgi:serine phosphatase RsbU (regulator of sigma subunit)